MTSNQKLESPLQTLAEWLNPDVLSNFDNLGVGGLRLASTLALRILRVCQRQETPCLVDIDYELEGEGIYELDEENTMFSLDTTDGEDGTWYELTPLTSDSQHTESPVTVSGKVQGRFVANMCNHLTTFLSEDRIVFRITFLLSDELPDPLILDKPEEP